MIIPTILETELSEILHKIDLLKNDATLIQIDLVENHFVNGETLLDTSYLKTINTVCDFELDLMVREPCEHIKSKIEKVKRACAYIKGECLYDFLNLCVANDYLAGLSLAPDDSIDLFEKTFNRYYGLLNAGTVGFPKVANDPWKKVFLRPWKLDSKNLV